MPEEPGIEEPPVCTSVVMPCFFAAAIIGAYSYGVFTAPKPAFASHTPSRAMLAKSSSTSPGSRITAPAHTRMPPGR